MDTKFFFDQKLVWAKIILNKRLYWTQHFFWAHKIFGPTIFLDLKSFSDQTRQGIKPIQTEHFRLKFCEIHKPNWQIKTMLVNQSKQGSNQGKKRLRLP